MEHFTQHYRHPHLGPFSKILLLGFAGVDIFFVLSGFILTAVYLELKLAGLRDFALRRILRIYPLHLAVLVVIMALGSVSIAWQFNAVWWRNLPAVALLLQPYLGLDRDLWNSPSWSAGVELSCYLLFPLALVLLRRLPVVALLLLVAA
ncbi:MAG: hypothetical protein B7Z81_02040, partial [Acidocella sp. 20-61-6]